MSRKWFVSWTWKGREGYNKGLEVSVDISRDMFIGGDDGVARFVYLEK